MTEQTPKQLRENRYQHLVEQARKWPNLVEGIANDFAIGRFKEELSQGAKDIATRVYEKTESAGIDGDVRDLVDLRYAYIMSCNYDTKIGTLLDEVRALISDKLDYVRVQEMRQCFRESMKTKR